NNFNHILYVFSYFWLIHLNIILPKAYFLTGKVPCIYSPMIDGHHWAQILHRTFYINNSLTPMLCRCPISAQLSIMLEEDQTPELNGLSTAPISCFVVKVTQSGSLSDPTNRALIS